MKTTGDFTWFLNAGFAVVYFCLGISTLAKITLRALFGEIIGLSYLGALPSASVFDA